MEFIELVNKRSTKIDIRFRTYLSVGNRPNDRSRLRHRFIFNLDLLKKIDVKAGDRLIVNHNLENKIVKFTKSKGADGFKIVGIEKNNYGQMILRQFVETDIGTIHIDHFEIDEPNSSIVAYF